MDQFSIPKSPLHDWLYYLGTKPITSECSFTNGEDERLYFKWTTTQGHAWVRLLPSLLLPEALGFGDQRENTVEQCDFCNQALIATPCSLQYATSQEQVNQIYLVFIVYSVCLCVCVQYASVHMCGYVHEYLCEYLLEHVWMCVCEWVGPVLLPSRSWGSNMGCQESLPSHQLRGLLYSILLWKSPCAPMGEQEPIKPWLGPGKLALWLRIWLIW